MTFNTDIVKRAEAIAARDGRNWADCIEEAHIEAQQPPLEKLVKKSDPRDEALRKRAVVAHLRHMPGEGNPDPDRRIEIGECETSLGRVRVAVSRDDLSVHGVNVPLTDIDRDLGEAVVETSASFAAATLDVEQSKQRTLVGLVIDGVLRRHEFLTAKVREAKRRERYDV
jgi:hypothetical protein